MNPLTPYCADKSSRLSVLLEPLKPEFLRSSKNVHDLIVQSKLDNFALWIYLKEFDFCVCFPAKNGGCSFRHEIIGLRSLDIDSMTLALMREFYKDGHGPFHPKEAEYLYPNVPHYLAVRHPVDRFKSLWRNKCRDRDGSPWQVYGMTPDELMDYIEIQEDHHWRMQVKNLTDHTEPMPMPDLLEMIGATARINKSGRLEKDPDVPVDRVLDYYADDLRIWEDACSRMNIVVESAAM